MKKKHKENSIKEVFKYEYFDSLEKLHAAETNFNLALPEFFELANAELTVARLRVDLMKNIYANSLTQQPI